MLDLGILFLAEVNEVILFLAEVNEVYEVVLSRTKNKRKCKV